MARSNSVARATAACATKLKAWIKAAHRAVRAVIAPELALVHALPRPQRLEVLESRRLLSTMTIINGTLDIEGDKYIRNTITVTKSGISSVLATVNSTSKTFAL